MKTIFSPGTCAVIPYVMAGDPDIETTRAILLALTNAGVSAIELGIPYGDPLADGPTIAAAGQRALANGTGIGAVLGLVREVAAQCAPIVLFTYFNPVYQYGIERFASEAANAGASGAIVPDIALEEGAALREALLARGLFMPLLVAPSTKPERAARIADAASGFVYVVSRLGVTGAGTAPDFSPVLGHIAMLRNVTDKPLAVGFGISKPEHVEKIRDAVDGVIIGSALIDAYSSNSGDDAAKAARNFIAPLIEAARVKAVSP